jgi:hypothetical protein
VTLLLKHSGWALPGLAEALAIGAFQHEQDKIKQLAARAAARTREKSHPQMAPVAMTDHLSPLVEVGLLGRH